MAEVPENGVGLTWADLMNYAQSQFDKIHKRFDKQKTMLDEQSAMLDDMINKMNKRNKEIINEVSKSDSNHDITSNNGDIIENVVIESGTLNLSLIHISPQSHTIKPI